MSALSDFLKQHGATDADLEQMKPMLEGKFGATLDTELAGLDQVKRAAAEASGKLNEFESQRNQFEVQAQQAAEKVAQYDQWYAGVLPTISKIQQDAIREAQRAASAEATLNKARELYQFEIPEDVPVTGAGSATPVPVSPSGVGATQPAAAAASATPAFDSSKFVTNETLQQQADMVGSAIAMAQNLAFEHSRLFPDRPIDFEALRSKAVVEKRPLREIWEREFNVAGRRAELLAADQAREQAAITAKIEAARREGFEQGLSKNINPATREAMPSRVGVVFTKRDGAADTLPWADANRRETGRMEKVIASLARSGQA